MSRAPIQGLRWNPWKLATIGMAVVFATALITGVVVANYVGSQKPNLTAADQPEPAPTVQPPAAGQAAVSVPPAPPPQVAVPPPPPVAAPPARYARIEPSSADVEACNRYARRASHNKTQETVTDGIIGGALGAGLGAAGGAIAGGGGGAGKGAGIGALVGAAGGTLFGLNQANQNDAHSAQAYRSCMKARGYSD